MNTERQNAFERAQARTTLADDRKTKFDRNDEARNKRLSDTTDREARIKRNAAQRASWRGDSRVGGARATSVLLDPETQALREKMEAEKHQPQAAKSAPPAPPPSANTIAAIILEWERNNPDYYRDSEFNAEAMKNFLLSGIAAGKLSWSYEALDTAYRWLRDNNFLESAPRPRKRGDFSSHPAPKIFPPFESAADSDARLNRAQVDEAQRVESDVSRALAMPFDQLQKSVRGSLLHYGETL